MALVSDRAASLLDPVLLLRTFYLASSALILVIQAIPALRSRFLVYGSRASPAQKPSTPDKSGSAQHARPSQLDHALDVLASIRVPHSYFTHFYVLSVCCSVFWALKLPQLPSPRAWHLSALIQDSSPRDSALAQMQLVWTCMFVQGLRRLLESYSFTSAPSSSKSRMWFGHWVLGLLFYFTTNIAVWIENVPIVDANSNTTSYGIDPAFQTTFRWKAALLTPAILTSHALQHTYHAYLFRLRTQNPTYQLPSHPLFPNLLCPHYTCEIAIYALLSLLAAPPGRWVNWTLVSATVFVAVNLGVTASGTREWCVRRFGEERVWGRWRVVPGVW